MPDDSNDAELDKILAEIEKPVEESNTPKKKTYKNDNHNEYEYSEDKELDDSEW